MNAQCRRRIKRIQTGEEAENELTTRGPPNSGEGAKRGRSSYRHRNQQWVAKYSVETAASGRASEVSKRSIASR